MLRWAVLAVYCAAAFACNLNALAFASIAKKAALFYGVSFNAINQITIVGMLMPFLGYPAAMWLADTHRFELPFYLSMAVMVAVRWVRVSFSSDGGIEGFWVILATQALSAGIGPCLGCLAPALSSTYFAKHERGLATSLGTIATLLGLGAGMTISPLYGDDIPALLELHALTVTVPLVLSLFCLDLCACVDDGQGDIDADGDLGGPYSLLGDGPGGPIRRTTSFRRLVRSVSSVSSPSEQGFSFMHPEEHGYWHTPSPFLGTEGNRELAAPGHSHGFAPHHGLTLPFVFNAALQNPVQDEDEYAPDQPSLTEAAPRDSYTRAVCRLLWDGAFLRMLCSIGLFCGVVNAWLALISEAAPESIDSAAGAQMVSGLFFGCGFLGALLMGAAMGRLGSYRSIGRVSCILSLPCVATAMLGWHYDVAALIYAGMALEGLVGFGLLPLCIEYGIALAVLRERQAGNSGASGDRLGGAVGGIVQCATNLFGVVIVMLTTPGNLPIDDADIPFVWLGLMVVGGLLFFTLPETNSAVAAATV